MLSYMAQTHTQKKIKHKLLLFLIYAGILLSTQSALYGLYHYFGKKEELRISIVFIFSTNVFIVIYFPLGRLKIKIIQLKNIQRDIN